MEHKGLDAMRAARILVELLAEQEGVQIDYTIEQDGEKLNGSTTRTKVSD